MPKNLVLLAGFLSLAMGGCAMAQGAAPATVATTAKGPAFVDAKGMSLYTFDKDSAGKSVCNGPCQGNWPAMMATASATASGGWSVITRDDGSKQWAYKDKPLYTFAKDTHAGRQQG